MGRLLVTTSYEASDAIAREADGIAEELDALRVPRGRSSIAKLRARYGGDGVLLLERDGLLKYYAAEAPPMFFHPSGAQLRIKKLERGEPDPLLDVSGAEAGDHIIDGTAGLASDAIVFAWKAGDGGRVTALEDSLILHRIVERGLRRYDSELPALEQAMRRVECLRADHLDYLRHQPALSADIVYFDPMFRHALTDSSSMSPLRDVANGQPLTEETVREACRVARKCVVLKEHTQSLEFERLGFREVRRTYSKIAYGVLRK